MTDPVSAEQLRVIVEMGDDYQPSERVAAALDALAAALADEADDVSGFGLASARSFLFDSSYQTGGSSGHLGPFPNLDLPITTVKMPSAPAFKV